MSQPQEDPYTVKLRNISFDITEEDIRDAMAKFGAIVKARIPMEELRNGKTRPYGFAFVTYERIDSATKALEEGEVVVDYSTCMIERAHRRAP